MYRAPLDFLEEYTTGCADCVLVNSHFTAHVFNETFKRLRHVHPRVLYPCVDVVNHIPNFEKKPTKECSIVKIVSLNRYERKKDIELALKAFARLRHTKAFRESRLQLIIAGGYSTEVKENVEYCKELKKLAKELNIYSSGHVSFLKNITDEKKYLLLQEALCLMYTPENEHFGIVPLEAGAMGTPVLACNRQRAAILGRMPGQRR
eukprot:TRINITY_DN11141_c0_g2_i4.p1 TRINITY_DN11141_c0_g2~~TRINITY_DN11141_c0_g2_i4.p1  ORF type:complete len:206 (+),score=35.83 TRINITY_DN11141_c0_g2_i4:880-1497(+)